MHDSEAMTVVDSCDHLIEELSSLVFTQRAALVDVLEEIPPGRVLHHQKHALRRVEQVMKLSL